MTVNCHGCCIEYGNADDDNNQSPSKLKCGIKGSFTDFLPITYYIVNGHLYGEDVSFFKIYPKTNTTATTRSPAAALLRVRNYYFQGVHSDTYLEALHPAYSLKGFLDFSTGSAVLRTPYTISTAFGILQTASVTASKK
jgi:hypothetical protein